MVNLEGWLELAALLSAAVAIVAVFSKIRASARRRASELKAAKSALTAHYEALNAIVDDPALPDGALEMLVRFTETIASQDECERFADVILKPPAKHYKTPSWFTEIEALRTSRPDIVENFHKAVASGLVALFLRWPNNSPKFEQMVAEVAADGRREALLAERVSKIRKSNGGDHLSGSLVAA